MRIEDDLERLRGQRVWGVRSGALRDAPCELASVTSAGTPPIAIAFGLEWEWDTGWCSMEHFLLPDPRDDPSGVAATSEATGERQVTGLMTFADGSAREIGPVTVIPDAAGGWRAQLHGGSLPAPLHSLTIRAVGIDAEAVVETLEVAGLEDLIESSELPLPEPDPPPPAWLRED